MYETYVDVVVVVVVVATVIAVLARDYSIIYY